MRRVALVLGSARAPLAVALLLALSPLACSHQPTKRGHWAEPPSPFTPEPPDPHPVATPWDASVPPPDPHALAFPADRAARKPRQVIGDGRFYCPFGATALAVSPDGTLLACGGGSPHRIVLFDPATGREVGRLYGPGTREIDRLVFSPDSKRLYAQGYVWDVAARRGLAQLPASDWGLTADGNTLVTVESVAVPWVGPGLGPELAVRRLVVRFRDTRTWKETEAFAATGMRPTLAVSPDGRSVALGGESGVVRVWDRQERKELPPLAALAEKAPGVSPHVEWDVTQLVFSPDGKTLAGSSGENYPGARMRHVALWAWPGGKLVHKLSFSKFNARTLAFTPDGHGVLAAGEDRTVVWDAASGAVRGKVDRDQSGAGYAAAVAPDGRRLYTRATWSRLQAVRLPDLVPLPLDPPLPPAPPKPPFATARYPVTPGANGPERVLPDGSRLRAGDARTGEPAGVLHLDPAGKLIRYYLKDRGVGFDVTADGKTLATYGYDNRRPAARELPLQLWDLATGAERAAITLSPPTPVSSSQFRFSPDGTRLAMAYPGGRVRLWGVAEKQPVLTLDPDGVAVGELTFSADGRFLVGGHGNNPAVVWDVTGAR